MTIFLISGNGQGAGKTTLAHRLVGERFTWSLAGILRQELKRAYPEYDWNNRTQAYKDTTQVPEYRIGQANSPFKVLSLREVMIAHGEAACKSDRAIWAKRLVAKLVMEPGLSVIAVDDVRKMAELEVLKAAFPNTYHFHVKFPDAVAEPQYDADELEAAADYVITRNN